MAKSKTGGKRQTSAPPLGAADAEPTAFIVPNFTRRPQTDAVSRLMLTIGGLGERLQRGDDPTLLVSDVANSIAASIRNQTQNDAEPPPADILAMMRLCEYFMRTEGDVAQTVFVPGEIILKPIEIGCDDAVAKKVWEHLWYDVLNIDALNSEVYHTVEVYGQAFPLEVWDGNELRGIAFLEPTSVWVGRHFKLGQFPMEFITPENFGREKLAAMIKDTVFNTIVTDQNIQTLPANRIPIPQDVLRPIYGRKFSWQRYAIPHIVYAARDIFHRQVLEEYRRGAIEGYINQLWMFMVGTSDWPATPAKIKRVKTMLDSAATDRTGVLVFDHTVKGEVLTPKTLDALLGNETWMQLTQAIFRDLGFSLFIVSGEIPGTHGRGGGVQVDVDLQLSIERWERRKWRFIEWCRYLSRKFAERSDPSLLNHLPKFIPGAIETKQLNTIKARIMPLLQAGGLSWTTALRDSGYDYETELSRKQLEQPNAELFQPITTFAQTFRPPGGKEQVTTSPTSSGRPTTNAPSLSASMNVLNGQMSAVESFRREIAERYDQLLEDAGQDKDAAIAAFAAWLHNELRARMTRLFQDGFVAWGGRGELTYDLLDSAQGLAFQQERLNKFANELRERAGDTDRLLRARTRAMMYAGALHTAYILGVQAAMQTRGALGWRRVLHPELSTSGPCNECMEDAKLVHSITEPFFEFHPNGVCSAQSIRFHFRDNSPVSVQITEY